MQNTAKQMLLEFENKRRRLRRQESEIRQYRSAIISPSTTRNEMPTTKEAKHSFFEKAISEIEVMQEKYNRELFDFFQERNRIMDVMDKLLNETEKEIIIAKYIQKKTWVAISREINYSERQTIRFRDEAIEKLNKAIKEGCP